MPGSPSPVGRKPGICQTGQLVTCEGPEGSNPSPGALHEGISERYKADESENRATNDLMGQKTSTIALRRRQQLYFARHYGPVLRTVDPAEAADVRAEGEGIALHLSGIDAQREGDRVVLSSG